MIKPEAKFIETVKKVPPHLRDEVLVQVVKKINPATLLSDSEILRNFKQHTDVYLDAAEVGCRYIDTFGPNDSAIVAELKQEFLSEIYWTTCCWLINNTPDDAFIKKIEGIFDSFGLRARTEYYRELQDSIAAPGIDLEKALHIVNDIKFKLQVDSLIYEAKKEPKPIELVELKEIVTYCYTYLKTRRKVDPSLKCRQTSVDKAVPMPTNPAHLPKVDEGSNEYLLDALILCKIHKAFNSDLWEAVNQNNFLAVFSVGSTSTLIIKKKERFYALLKCMFKSSGSTLNQEEWVKPLIERHNLSISGFNSIDNKLFNKPNKNRDLRKFIEDLRRVLPIDEK